MLPVENQTLLAYTTGAIQMVPGRAGYEPAHQRGGSGETGLMQTSRGTRYQRPEAQNENHETAYTENRRLTSFGMSDVGSFIDLYA